LTSSTRQRLVPAENQPIATDGCAGGRDRREAIHEASERDRGFEPGQVVAQADVRPGAEAQRLVPAARRIESVGLREERRVTVRRAQ
jgi:hypothetical protein